MLTSRDAVESCPSKEVLSTEAISLLDGSISYLKHTEPGSSFFACTLVGAALTLRKPPNMVFLGNPGTGKTKVARMLAHILKNLGAIKKDKVVEVQRTELIGRYIGQTGPQTREQVCSRPHVERVCLLCFDGPFQKARGSENLVGEP